MRLQATGSGLPSNHEGHDDNEEHEFEFATFEFFVAFVVKNIRPVSYRR
jgi:hypothetical protein